MEFSAKQKKQLRDIEGILIYVFSSLDWSSQSDYEFSLKYERKERQCLHTARRLCLNSFFDGYNLPNIPISAIAYNSKGLILVEALGAKVQSKTRHDTTAPLRARLVNAFNSLVELNGEFKY